MTTNVDIELTANTTNPSDLLLSAPGFGLMSLRQRALCTYRKLAYLQANKYLKEAGVIQRYKSKREVGQFFNAGWLKVARNICKDLVQHELGGLPRFGQINTWQNTIDAIFNPALTRWDGAPTALQRQNWLDLWDRLTVLQSAFMNEDWTNLITIYLSELRHSGRFDLSFNVSNVNLLANYPERPGVRVIAISEFHNCLIRIKEAIRGPEDGETDTTGT